MAADTQARMQFSLIDAQGVKASLNMPAFVDGASTFAAAKTAWLAQAVLLDAVTSAQIQHGSVTILPSDLTGLKTSPALDSRVQETGNLDFKNATTRYVYDSVIPSIADAVLTSPIPNQIDEGNAAVIAYVGALTGALLGGHFSNHEFQALTALVDSFLSDRKRRRSLHQKSLRVP